MRKSLLFLCFVLFYALNNNIRSQVIFQDDFDSYVSDSIIDPQSTDWTGWDNLTTSAYVSDDTSASGNNSLKIWNATVPGSGVALSDLTYSFGNKTTGRYLVTFKVFVPSQVNGSGAGTYWNMLHVYNNSAIGAEWAFQVYLRPQGQTSTIEVGSTTFVVPTKYDQWVNVAHIIDLDRDLHDFYYDGQMVMSQRFSQQPFSTSGTLQLAAIDFFAECGGVGCVQMGYFDDFLYKNFPDQNNDAGLTNLNVPDYCAGFPVALDVTVKNFGFDTINSVSVDWSVDGVAQTSILYNTAPIFPNSTVSVNLGNYTFTGASHDVKVWTSNPNMNTDTVNFNDTLKMSIGSPTVSGPNLVCPSVDFVLSASGNGIGVTYEWQYLDTNTSTWVSANAFSQIYPVIGGISSSMDFRVIMSCTGGGTDTSSVHSIGLNSYLNCYCTPLYTTGCTFGDDLNSFTLTGVNGTSINDLNTGCSPNAYDDRTFLPVIDLVAGLTHHGTINSNYTFPSEYAKIWIDFGDDGQFQDSTDLVGSVGPFYNLNQALTINVPSLADSGLHRMRVRAVYGASTFAFDACGSQFYGETHDYMVYVISPSCKVPYALAANNITPYAADLSWTEAGLSTQWLIEYGTAGFFPGTGSDTLVTALPFTLPNLSPNTEYEFYVSSVCGRNDTSYAAGPFKFRTLCVPYTAPHYNGFENETAGEIPSCWNYKSTNIEGFVSVEAYTGFNAPHSGLQAVYMYEGWNVLPGIDSLILVSPTFTDLTAGDKQIRFHASTSDTSNYLIIGTTPDPTLTTLNVIDTIHFSDYDVYEEIILTFETTTGYNGTDQYIYFENALLSDFSYLRIDELHYEQIPSCKKPRDIYTSNLSDTSATIGWTEKNLATEWIVEYGLSGFTKGMGQIDTVTVNPYMFDGLLSNTDYEFYVRSICGRNDTSFWTGPFSFTTLCTPVANYPYLQEFNSFTAPCWEVADNGNPTTGPLDKGFSAWYQGDFLNDPSNGRAVAINLFSSFQSDWIISEPFDLSGAGAQPYELRLKVGIVEFMGTNSSAMGTDDEVRVLISVDKGLTWNTLYTWDDSNAPSNVPSTVSIPLGAYTASHAIFALWGTDGTTPDPVDYEFFVDDFEVRETPTCLEASNLSAMNIGSFSADLMWTENNAASQWQIEYGPAGFSIGTGIDSIANSNPKTINGLAAHQSYEFYVRSICAPGDTSFWFGPFEFETLLPPCTGTPNSASVIAPSSVCAGVGFQLAAAGVSRANGISYDWQIFDVPTQTWVSSGMTDFADSVDMGIVVPTSYRFITSCSFSGLADTSSPVLIDIKPTLQCYCTPDYETGCAFGDEINDFTLTGAFGTSINDLNTGCSVGGYDDRTALSPVVLETGNTYTGTISSNFGSQYAKIWIDFDDDGSFDPTDVVSTVGPFGAGPTTFSVNIPAVADSGLHRMRVRGVFVGTGFLFDACGTQFYGEAHDYMVYIGTLVNCAGQPDSVSISGPASVCTSVPFSVVGSGMSFGNGISYQWEESPGGANTWTAIPSATGPNYTSTSGVVSATDYRMISTCSYSGLSDTSNVHSVSIKAVIDCYCVPSYSSGCAFGDDINTFTLNGVNNTFISDLNSGCSNNSYDDKSYYPTIDLVVGLTHQGSINSTSNWTDGYAKIWIDFGDDGVFTDSVDLVGTVGGFNSALLPFSITIPANAVAGQHRMRVRNVPYTPGFTFDACLDQSSGEAHDYSVNIIIPTCAIPSALGADNITTSSSDINWIENGISTEWQIQHGVAGFMLGNGTHINSTSKPVAISGLSPNSEYEFYVRSVCGRGDTSYWAGPFKYATPCVSVSAFPYTENFDGPTIDDVWECWQVLNIDGGETWSQDNAFLIAHSGTFTAHGMGNNNDMLISPQFDLPASPMWLKVWDIVENSALNNIYSVLVSTTGRNVADFTDTLATYDVTNNVWVQRTLDLSAYANQSIYIAMWQSYSASAFWGFGLDDFRIEPQPNCLPPSNFTALNVSSDSVEFSWTENNSATQWAVEYGTLGFSLGNGTKSTVGTNPTSISGLIPNTTYEFYIRSVCGANDSSAWAGPFSITTECAANSIYPYSQGFASFVPKCWEIADNGARTAVPTDFGTSDWAQGFFLNDPLNGDGVVINLWTNTHEDWIISESFDLSAGTNPYKLLLDAGVTDWQATAADNMGTDDEVHVLISTDDGLTWTSLYSWNASNQPPNTGTTVTIPLNSYTGPNNKFAIWATDGTIADPDDYDFHISNFLIDYVTGIDKVENSLANISILPNPSKGIFHVVGNKVKDEVEISIFNSNGKLVYQSDDKFSNNFDERIDISDFSKGLYFVKLQSKSSMEMKKIVIQ